MVPAGQVWLRFQYKRSRLLRGCQGEGGLNGERRHARRPIDACFGHGKTCGENRHLSLQPTPQPWSSPGSALLPGAEQGGHEKERGTASRWEDVIIRPLAVTRVSRP